MISLVRHLQNIMSWFFGFLLRLYIIAQDYMEISNRSNLCSDYCSFRTPSGSQPGRRHIRQRTMCIERPLR